MEARAQASHTHRDLCEEDMDSLPRDVVLQVFSFLPAAELVHSVSAVCREWRALASDPDAWRVRRLRLSMRPQRTLSPVERQVLRRTPALRALAISTRRNQDLPAPLSELLPECWHLRELHLAIPRLTLDLMADVRRHWPRLQELRVDATHIDDGAFEEISRLQHVTRVQVSALQGCGWAQLQRLSGCPNLRALHFNANCPASAPTDTGTGTGLGPLSDRLTELHLGTLLPASDQLFTAIGQCHKLRHLHVEDCTGLSDSGLAALSLGSPALSLEYLCLRGLTAVSPAGLHRFIYSCDLSRLRDLRLPGSTALSDPALHLLARRCSSLPKLVADDCPRVSRGCYESLWGAKAPDMPRRAPLVCCLA